MLLEEAALRVDQALHLTAVANVGRLDRPLRQIGQEAELDKAQFEKMFITTPETAAATILRGVRRNSRRVLIGPDAVVVDLMQRLLPTGYQKLISLGTKLQLSKKK